MDTNSPSLSFLAKLYDKHNKFHKNIIDELICDVIYGITLCVIFFEVFGAAIVISFLAFDTEQDDNGSMDNNEKNLANISS